MYSRFKERENLSWRLRFRVEKITKKLGSKSSNKSNHPAVSDSYSEVLQDRFVLQMLQRKRLGSYVELGAGNPIVSSNSYLLENQYGWRGISVELDSTLVKHFREIRSNPIVQADATIIDYGSLFREFNLPVNIDYLQIDIDPADQSLKSLMRIPFDKFTFSVITFEHDRYRANKKIAQTSRGYLSALGYELVVKNVLVDTLKPFEDWWIHPNFISEVTWRKFQSKFKNPFDLNWD